MARYLLCLLVTVMLAVLVLCDDKNATATEKSVAKPDSTPKPPAVPDSTPKLPAVSHANFFGDLLKAAGDIPKAIFATCMDTSKAFMDLLKK